MCRKAIDWFVCVCFVLMRTHTYTSIQSHKTEALMHYVYVESLDYDHFYWGRAVVDMVLLFTWC